MHDLLLEDMVIDAESVDIAAIARKARDMWKEVQALGEMLCKDSRLDQLSRGLAVCSDNG